MNFETEPSGEFLAHLEWQVRTEARRAGRFARPAAARGWRGLRAAAALLLALALGAGGVFAAQEWQHSREAGLRAAQWDVRLALASARLRSATEERDEARARFEGGAGSQDELVLAERARVRVELDCARLESEAAEVRETGAEPSDRISAPLVGGLDFVRQRLEFAAGDAHADVLAAEQRKALASQRLAAGVATDADLRDAAQAQQAALAREQLVVRRLELRAAFADGRLLAAAAELDDLRIAAECAVTVQNLALAFARRDLAHVEALAQAGVVPQQELRRAQRGVAEAEAALRLAQLELGVLAGKGRR